MSCSGISLVLTLRINFNAHTSSAGGIYIYIYVSKTSLQESGTYYCSYRFSVFGGILYPLIYRLNLISNSVVVV